MSKFLHKTVKICLSFDIKGSVLWGPQILFGLLLIHETLALFLLWFHTEHFHTALKYLPLKKKKKQSYHSEFLTLMGFFFWKQKHTECGGPTSLFSQYAIVRNIFLSTCFPALYCFISFYAREAHFIFQMMSAEGQTRGRFFLDLLLCLLELPGVLQGSGAESSFRPRSLWTGSVALIAQVIDQIKESTVIPLSVLLRDGCRWLKVGGRQGYVSVQSVYQYSLYLSCHLVDLAVLFSVVQRPVLNCIKLYRLCKKLNVA